MKRLGETRHGMAIKKASRAARSNPQPGRHHHSRVVNLLPRACAMFLLQQFLSISFPHDARHRCLSHVDNIPATSSLYVAQLLDRKNSDSADSVQAPVFIRGKKSAAPSSGTASDLMEFI